MSERVLAIKVEIQTDIHTCQLVSQIPQHEGQCNFLAVVSVTNAALHTLIDSKNFSARVVSSTCACQVITSDYLAVNVG